jgi:hypothetical protein
MSEANYVTPEFVSLISRWGLAGELRSGHTAITAGSTAWPTANKALYLPLWLPWPYPVARMWWVNGSAAGGNWDIGLFTINGRQLYAAGSTVGSGNSLPQFVSPSSVLLLSPGRYFIGIAHSATTANQMWGASSLGANRLRQYGCLEQASALPLPSSMTGVAITATVVPLCGITRTASGG